jgi:hypothetical protein
VSDDLALQAGDDLGREMAAAHEEIRDVRPERKPRPLALDGLGRGSLDETPPQGKLEEEPLGFGSGRLRQVAASKSPRAEGLRSLGVDVTVAPRARPFQDPAAVGPC